MQKLLLFAVMALLGAASPEAMRAQSKIIVSKEKLMLYVVDGKSDTIFSAPVSVGTNYGQKQKKGDRRTPEGSFKVVNIQDASSWTHDFHDGHGQRKGAYGPYFIRLLTPPFTGIGIHGTCFPELIGTRSSEGCIRLNNADVRKLRKLVTVGMPCIIEKDK